MSETAKQKYKRRVLIVDDAPFFRVILRDLLEQEGHEAATAENGREALDRMREESFDLLLLDINMPEMDGFEVLGAMETLEAETLPKVLVITGESFHKPHIKQARDLGAAGFICKSDPPEYTMTRIKQALF